MSERVWLVYRGLYDDKHIEAVYASLDAAKAAYPREEWKEDEGDWWNDKDWDDSLHIQSFPVQPTTQGESK